MMKQQHPDGGLFYALQLVLAAFQAFKQDLLWDPKYRTPVDDSIPAWPHIYYAA